MFKMFHKERIPLYTMQCEKMMPNDGIIKNARINVKTVQTSGYVAMWSKESQMQYFTSQPRRSLHNGTSCHMHLSSLVQTENVEYVRGMQ